MEISGRKKLSLSKSRSAPAIAVALAAMISAPVFADGLESFETENALVAIQQQYSLTGPILVGPVEAVLADGKAIRVLGVTIDTPGLVDLFLPAQYVAVFGTLSADGTIVSDSIALLDEVYAPGSSLVLFSGWAATQQMRPDQLKVGNQAVDGLNLPGFGKWITSQGHALVVVAGTQSIEGAPIVANTVVSFAGNGFLGIRDTGIRAIDGSGIRAIDGSGIRAIDGSGIRAIDGSGIRAIDGSGIRAIDGSGIRAIDGSGIRAIDGSGIRAIDGSGIRAIDGSGIRAIDGSGIRAIDGSGIRAIDGSGIRAIDGSGIRAIDGSGIRATTTSTSGA